MRLRDGSAAIDSAATFQRGTNQLTLTAEIADPKVWRPGTQHLYDYSVTTKIGGSPADIVSSYFALPP